MIKNTVLRQNFLKKVYNIVKKTLDFSKTPIITIYN